MSNEIKVIWTALPNGFVPGSNSKLRLSLFASVQIKTDSQNPRLSEIDLDNWTVKVKGYSFRVSVGGGEQQVTPKNDFHPEMWAALFGDPTPSAPGALGVRRRSNGPAVRSYERPRTDEKALSKAEILTYDVGGMGDNLLSKYGALANQQSRFVNQKTQTAELSRAQVEMTQFREALNIYLRPDPTEQERLNTLKAVAELDSYIADLPELQKPTALAYKSFFVDRISKNSGYDLLPQTLKEIQNQIAEEINKKFGAGGDVILRSTRQTDMSAVNFINFHSPVHPVHEGETHRAAPPIYDFHEMLTMLANYPVLMRMLGLVIDVEVDAVNVLSEGVVSVIKAGPETNPQPKTHYKMDAGKRRFIPKPGPDPLITDGLLNLRSGHFSIETADIDGALLKHLTKALDERRGEPGPSTRALAKLSDDELPPSLRTLGISVLYRDRKKFLERLLKKAENSSTDPGNCEFFAEDLIRGFRVDVYEEDTRKWYSLCERAETYHFLGEDGADSFRWPQSGSYEAEGIVHLGVTKPKLSEDVAPHLQVLQQHESLFRWENWSLCLPFPQTPLDAKTNPLAPTQGTPLKLRPEFGIVPKTLPKLRFGKRYFLRCRVVDPAGNSMDKDDLKPAKDEPETVQFSAALGVGDSPFFFARHEPVNPPVVLVTREIDPEESPGEQLHRLVIRDGKSTSERCAVPGRVTAMTAIIDGRYDDGTARDAGAFSGAKLDPKSGDFPLEPDDREFKNPIFRHQPANSPPPKQPYLPDPFAVGSCVALCTVNNQEVFELAEKNELDCYFYEPSKSWPHAQPFLIRLVAADKQQPIASLYRQTPLRPLVTTAEVAVPPGEIVKVRLSSMLGRVEHKGDQHTVDTHNLEKMALWRLTHPDQKSSPIVKDDPVLQKRIVCGDFPLYTPHRDLTLVHAVRKPLKPELKVLTLTPRSLADTHVKLNFEMNLHRTSTGRVECEAEWNEPLDDVSQPKCVIKNGLGRPGELKVPLEGAPVEKPEFPQHNDFLLEASHKFGDTKHRMVRYSLRATTRFREYYPEAPKPKNEHDEEERAQLQTQEHERHTTVFAVKEENILSTARPPAVNLAYVIPTFRWEQAVPEKAAPHSRRWGGGLRVYLERPWFATGEDELLGVVLYQGKPDVPLCKVMIPHVTQWGRDPIWGLKPSDKPFPDRNLPAFPGKNSFRSVGRGIVRYEDSLTLEALKNLDPVAVNCAPGTDFRVSVAGFQAEFDEERGLWRCDLEMDPGQAYFPMVRLALARYQYHSLPDCKLSAVVQAEFMQLTPDRFANMEYESDSNRIKLTVTGFSYQSRRAAVGPATDATGRMSVAVEERCKNRHGDLRWLRIPVPGSGPNGYLEPVSTLHNNLGESIWSFQISLPRSRKVSRYRLVIVESEVITQDKDNGHLEYRDGSRIVYADVLGV